MESQGNLLTARACRKVGCGKAFLIASLLSFTPSGAMAQADGVPAETIAPNSLERSRKLELELLQTLRVFCDEYAPRFIRSIQPKSGRTGRISPTLFAHVLRYEGVEFDVVTNQETIHPDSRAVKINVISAEISEAGIDKLNLPINIRDRAHMRSRYAEFLVNGKMRKDMESMV
jgi:hypothetical protein